MTKIHSTRLTLNKKTLFVFDGSEAEKRGGSTEPTTLTATITSGLTIFLSKKK